MTKSIISDEFIFNFSEENYLKLLSFPEYLDKQDKIQVKYLFEYLTHLKCETIVVEKNYMDKYYLDDYLHFYANCLKDYKRNCKRLHFFSTSNINESVFFSKLDEDNKNDKTISSKGSKASQLNKNYLGFIVNTPLDSIMIGRTILSVYPDTLKTKYHGNEKKERHFNTLRRYNANLFGIDLTIESLPFHEQDSTVHACATCALWTVLEKTTHMFGYNKPTSYQIKKNAHKIQSIERTIPSMGLKTIQVINAVREFGLDVEVREFQNTLEKTLNRQLFKEICYSFLRGGFPIFLGVCWENEKFYENNNNENDNFDNEEQKSWDYHALAVLGYKLKNEENIQCYYPNVANGIEKIYVHDDNRGPFAKYKIKEERENIFLERDDRKDQLGNKKKIYLDTAIIPIYHKIRYPYAEISNFMFRVSKYLDKIKFKLNYAWDCYLTNVNSLKKNFRSFELFNSLPLEQKRKILAGFYPRFIWRCSLCVEGIIVGEFLADATESKSQFPFFEIFFYSNKWTRYFKKIFKQENCKTFLTKKQSYYLLKNIVA